MAAPFRQGKSLLGAMHVKRTPHAIHRSILSITLVCNSLPEGQIEANIPCQQNTMALQLQLVKSSPVSSPQTQQSAMPHTISCPHMHALICMTAATPEDSTTCPTHELSFRSQQTYCGIQGPSLLDKARWHTPTRELDGAVQGFMGLSTTSRENSISGLLCCCARAAVCLWCRPPCAPPAGLLPCNQRAPA